MFNVPRAREHRPRRMGGRGRLTPTAGARYFPLGMPHPEALDMHSPMPPAVVAARSSTLPLLPLALLATLAACRAGDHRKTDTTAAAPLPSRAALASGFRRPVAATYDSAADRFFVANLGDDSASSDGFISRVRPDGTIDSLRFITGARGGATLHAPRGLALVGDTLWVADVDAVRGFDARTGAPVATIDLAAEHPVAPSGLAAGPDGSLYVTDRGIRDGGAAPSHPPGTDRIFRITPDHRVSVALATDDLERPSAIAWDPRGHRFIIVAFGGSSIFAWHPGDATPTLIGHGASRLDGVALLPDDRLVVAAWKDSSLTIRWANQETVIEGFPTPSGIAVDTRRMHVAVPLVSRDRVEIWAVPPLPR